MNHYILILILVFGLFFASVDGKKCPKVFKKMKKMAQCVHISTQTFSDYFDAREYCKAR